MKLLLYISVCLALVTACNDPNVSSESLQPGDSLFVDKDLRLSIYSRVHRTNNDRFEDGHAQVDSNKIEGGMYFNSFNRKFFFDREHTFVGIFESTSEYNKDQVMLSYLSPDIKREILKDKKHFGRKFVAEKKKFYSGEIHKGVMLENFPDEIYFDLHDLNIASADSVFSVLK